MMSPGGKKYGFRGWCSRVEFSTVARDPRRVRGGFGAGSFAPASEALKTRAGEHYRWGYAVGKQRGPMARGGAGPSV